MTANKLSMTEDFSYLTDLKSHFQNSGTFQRLAKILDLIQSCSLDKSPLIFQTLQTIFQTIEYHDIPLHSKQILKGSEVIEGESRFIEFKINNAKELHDKVKRGLNGLRNSEGGHMYIGIDDKHEFALNLLSKNELEDLMQKAKEYMEKTLLIKDDYNDDLDQYFHILEVQDEEQSLNKYVLRIEVPMRVKKRIIWLKANMDFCSRLDAQSVLIQAPKESQNQKINREYLIKVIEDFKELRSLSTEYKQGMNNLWRKEESLRIIEDNNKTVSEKCKGLSQLWDTKENQELCKRKFFKLGESIHDHENIETIFEEKFNVIGAVKNILALMNQEGGRIYYGIDKSQKKIIGIRASKSSKDKNKKAIQDSLTQLKVCPVMSRRVFFFHLPVVKDNLEIIENRIVLKIQVLKDPLWYHPFTDSKFYQKLDKGIVDISSQIPNSRDPKRPAEDIETGFSDQEDVDSDVEVYTNEYKPQDR